MVIRFNGVKLSTEIKNIIISYMPLTVEVTSNNGTGTDTIISNIDGIGGIKVSEDGKSVSLNGQPVGSLDSNGKWTAGRDGRDGRGGGRRSQTSRRRKRRSQSKRRRSRTGDDSFAPSGI